MPLSLCAMQGTAIGSAEAADDAPDQHGDMVDDEVGMACHH